MYAVCKIAYLGNLVICLHNFKIVRIRMSRIWGCTGCDCSIIG